MTSEVVFEPRAPSEQFPAAALRGGLAALVIGGVVLAGAALILVGAFADSVPVGAVGGVAALAAVACLAGMVIVEPNESSVVVLFGRYRGTIAEAGWYWVNPFTRRETISLRVRNFQ